MTLFSIQEGLRAWLPNAVAVSTLGAIALWGPTAVPVAHRVPESTTVSGTPGVYCRGYGANFTSPCTGFIEFSWSTNDSQSVSFDPWTPSVGAVHSQPASNGSGTVDTALGQT